LRWPCWVQRGSQKNSPVASRPLQVTTRRSCRAVTCLLTAEIWRNNRSEIRAMPTSIIDTHLHLWDPGHLRYSWLDDDPLLNKPYLLDGYRKATSGLAIEQMVFVQCEVDTAFYRQEVEWVANLAAIDERIASIVPWAPLELGEGADEEVAELADNDLVKGIRRIIQFESDAEFCLRPGFVRGVRNLANHGLHFEVCLKGDEQFANCLDLVEQCPEVRFLLNHIGKPYIKD